MSRKAAITTVIISVIVLVIVATLLVPVFIPGTRRFFVTNRSGGFIGRGVVTNFTALQKQTAPNAAAVQEDLRQPNAAATKRLVIKNAYLRVRVKNIVDAINKINDITDNFGGFVVNSDVRNLTNRASITIRIPAKQLNKTLLLIHKLALKVISERVQGRDITAQYVDMQSRLKNLLAAETQLTKIMAKARKTPDVLMVYNKIVSIRSQINVLQGRIKYYKQSVNYSKINIYLTKKAVTIKKYLAIKAWRVGYTIKNAAIRLVNATNVIVRIFFTIIILYLPIVIMILIPIFIFIWLLLLLVRLMRKKPKI